MVLQLTRLTYSDFLQWSLDHEGDLLVCLENLASGCLRTSLTPPDPTKWLLLLQSQFVRFDLCRLETLSRFKQRKNKTILAIGAQIGDCIGGNVQGL
jgi:hypothetical protein